MTRQAYLEKRKGLIEEAQILLNEGNLEGYNAKEKEINELDAKFDNISKTQANLNALKEPKVMLNVLDDEKSINNKQTVVEDVRTSKDYKNAFMKTLLGKDLNEIERKAFDSSNAGAIPEETANMLFDKMIKIAPMLSEITLLRVAGNVKFTVEGTRNDAALHTENAAITPSADTMVTVSLAGYELVKVIRISKTVQTMTIPAFEGWLTDMLAEDIAELAENYIINGTGSSQPKGVANATTYTDGSNAVEYTNGGTVTFSEVNELISYLPARYDKNAKFLCNKKFLYQQFANVKDSQGQPILVKDMVNGLKLAIMGYPVLISDKVADGEAYLGDFKKIVGNLPQDVTVESSAESGFLNNAIDFRGSAIFDCDIALSDAFVKLSEASV